MAAQNAAKRQPFARHRKISAITGMRGGRTRARTLDPLESDLYIKESTAYQ